MSISEAIPGRDVASPLLGVRPHGGKLVRRLVSTEEREGWLDIVHSLPSVVLTPREISDIECLAVGAFSPLEGFMSKADYASVVVEMRLSSGLPWSLPVTLAATTEEALDLKTSENVALRDSEGELLAILHLEGVFAYDREEEAERVFRTSDPLHPGAAALLGQGEWLLSGRVSVIRLPRARPFVGFRLTPQETRLAIADRGWRSVIGFQTRNPIHRAHEYLTKCALEMVDGLLLHPLVGETKSDDVPAEVRMDAYRVLLEDYYPKDRVLLAVFPAAMRYAGPREAIFHAICRKNYGCTHFIVGRDHAGVGDFYGSFDSHDIFGEFEPDEIGITPLFFDHAFYCKACEQMATTKTCPHGTSERVALSGSEVRRRLQTGDEIPAEFSRPEVASILRKSSEAN